MSIYAANTTTVPLFDGVHETLFGMFSAATKYRQYRKTISELSDLTHRELDDLGLSRSSIKSVAMEAVYGA